MYLAKKSAKVKVVTFKIKTILLFSPERRLDSRFVNIQ